MATLTAALIATIQPHDLVTDLKPRYSVQWAPEKAGPLPLFAGELIVEGESDYDGFTLRIRGKYEPPLRVLGERFDIALGNRIAAKATEGLPQRIRFAVERSFRADEAGKRTPRAGRKLDTAAGPRLTPQRAKPRRLEILVSESTPTRIGAWLNRRSLFQERRVNFADSANAADTNGDDREQYSRRARS